MVILLDLVGTLALPADRKIRPHRAHIRQVEQYDAELLQAIQDAYPGAYIILVTGRRSYYMAVTLESIAAKLGGWQPDEAHFAVDEPPHTFKARLFREHISPRLGDPDETDYLAIESNTRTRAAYKQLGVRAIPKSMFLREVRRGNQPGPLSTRRPLGI